MWASSCPTVAPVRPACLHATVGQEPAAAPLLAFGTRQYRSMNAMTLALPSFGREGRWRRAAGFTVLGPGFTPGSGVSPEFEDLFE